MAERVIKQRGTATNYLDLVHSISVSYLGPLAEVPTEDRYLAIRHDVDHSLESAMEFARFENRCGIRSSYFLLHTESYFENPKFVDQCRELSNLGHEIGLHYNVLPIWWEGRDPWVEIDRALSKIRSLGIPVMGASSHGDSRCRLKGRKNYEVFTVSRSNNSDTPKKRDLSEFGLRYEAYFLPCMIYLSDSGGYWAHYSIPGDEFMAKRDKEENPFRLIDYYNRRGNGIFQLLVHWDWWKLN